MSNIFKYLLLSVVFIPSSFAEDNPDRFDSWLAGFKETALSQGISRAAIENAFYDVRPIERVVNLDKKQPHKTITFEQYKRNVISRRRVVMGKTLMKENEYLLNEISRKYGVQPRFIVALWGIETDFGGNMGGFYVPASLATLAFEGRRKEFFQKELISSLKILDEGHIDFKQMKGSWAGAMGQTQFMPSSFLKYAVDYNGDGRRDIWSTRSDVFASIANYLSSFEWDNDATWGRKVKLPDNFDYSLADMEITKGLGEWQKIGVRKIDGGDLPGRKDLEASIVMPDGKDGEAFMVYGNYKKILKWNRSTYFATAVGLFSDAIKYGH